MNEIEEREYLNEKNISKEWLFSAILWIKYYFIFKVIGNTDKQAAHKATEAMNIRYGTNNY